MGIQGLTKLIGDSAPGGMKENDIKNYFGRKVAIDASMSIYQFLIAVRSEGNQLQNEAGETTSHLMGMFYRTVRMVDNGIKPVYVFDGKPPALKSGQLDKRRERREGAEKDLAAAKEEGDQENIDKFSRRLVKVTKQHNEDCKKLLRLMGIPYVDAPCEAEAQCAELVKKGLVYATATEDMDALTFGSGVLLRHMTYSEARKMPIQEFHLSRVLDELQLNTEEFIDLCILLGCDYCGSIRGIGPTRALALIKQHRSIENILKNLDQTKYPVEEDWKYKEAREFFKAPEVTDGKELDSQIKWTMPDEEAIVEFMCTQNNFNEERIRSSVKKLVKAKGTATQVRLDSFFTITPSANGAAKRKANDKDNKNSAKKGKPAANAKKPLANKKK